MKIKSKLKISMFVSILAMVFSIIMLANTFMRLKTASALETRTDDIVRGVFELTILTNDYLILKNAGTVRQWQVRHRQLTELLQQSKVKEIDQQQLSETMLQHHETNWTLFEKLSAIGATPPEKQSHLDLQQWDQLNGQITTTELEIVSIAFRLNAMAKSERVSAQNQGGVIILSLIIILVVVNITTALFSGRSTVKSIIRLQQDIKKINWSNLDHFIPSKSNDEIGELATAFNTMTKNLRKVMSSKDTLATEISKRKEVEKQLRKARNELEMRVQKRTAQLAESNEKYCSLFNDALDMIHIVDEKGWITDANPAELTTLGYTKEEYIGKHLSEIIHPDYREKTELLFQKVLNGEDIDIYETALLTKTGETVHVEINAVPQKKGGQGVRAVLRNISIRKSLERQLIQAQKMEAIGTLAGGVAHDFNNMLGVILGHTEILFQNMAPEDPEFANLKEVHKAAQRSADLTRQLLAFARKQTIVPKVLNLNDTVDGMLKMLRRLIGEDIDLAWHPDANIWQVQMDPAQLDQILANLCINARDAVAGVGKVTIETQNIILDQAYCAKHFGFNPGRYVMLAVSDNGCGIDKANLDKVFEPFFTTKESGKGTGLGLSTVYGIVKQNNGFINVYSEPGYGTSLKIYLPMHGMGLAEEADIQLTDMLPGKGETILLVEDEEGLLAMGKEILERLKYTVLTANNPDEAMEVAHKNTADIHLLITDVVMPQKSGKELAEQIQALNPEIKVLYMSGYPANVIANHGVLNQGTQFIPKPFSINSLSVKVREVLDPQGYTTPENKIERQPESETS